jgi:hypothetical protein
MALRDQPYLPLYVQDVLTDEKLIECSAEAHGVYFRLLCILHKQESYGMIELKAKYKQNKNKLTAFAEMLCKQMPFDLTIILQSIKELIEERVIFIEGDCLCQKRMIRDFEISTKRALSGAIGGKKGRNSGTKRYYNAPGYLYLIYDKDDNTAFKIGISAEPEKRIKGIIRKTGRINLVFRHKWSVGDMGESEQKVLDYFDDIRDGEWIYGDYTIKDIEDQIIQILNESKIKANTENENEDEDVIDIDIENRKRKPFKKPLLNEVEIYFEENGYKKEIGKKAWMGYTEADWFDSKGKPILNWKQKMINVWFKDENKKPEIKQMMP